MRGMNKVIFRGDQPAADCFCDFLVIGTLRGVWGGEYRGGAGTIPETAGSNSGKRAAVGSASVRANSDGEMGGGLHRLVVIEHPPGQHRFGGLRDPLVDQSGDLSTQIRGVIETREFKTLQGGARGGLQIIERWSESRNGHGQCSK